MLFRTHIAFALFVALVLIYANTINFSFVFFIAVMLFAALPDIDTPDSVVGRAIRPLSNLIRVVIGHRTVFHSVWFPIIIYYLLFWFNQTIAFAALFGYSSHLLLDILNEKGLKPLWPINFHISGPFRTGGFFEIILFFVIIILDLLLTIKLFL